MMYLFWVTLLSACLQLSAADSGGATAAVVDESSKKNDPEFQKLFKNFFDAAAGATYFYKFIDEGKKALNKPTPGGGSDTQESPKEDSVPDKSSDAVKDEQKKDKPPLAAKVFAFYGKAYGCQHSKIYKEYLMDYKKGETGCPKEPNPAVDDKWLMKIADSADSVSTGEDSSVPISEAETKFKGLTPEQRDLLVAGVNNMPLSAQTYIHFIIKIGCSNSNELKYQKFKTELKALVAKVEAQPPNPNSPRDTTYWIIKADSIIVDL